MMKTRLALFGITALLALGACTGDDGAEITSDETTEESTAVKDEDEDVAEDDDNEAGNLSGAEVALLEYSVVVPWPAVLPDDDVDWTRVCEDLVKADVLPTADEVSWELSNNELSCVLTSVDPEGDATGFADAYLAGLASFSADTEIEDEESTDAGASFGRQLVRLEFDTDPEDGLEDLGSFSGREASACADAAAATEFKGVWAFQSSTGFNDEYTIVCRGPAVLDAPTVDPDEVADFAADYEFPRD